MAEKFGGLHTSSVIEDALGLAKLNLDIIQGLEKSLAVGDIQSVGLDLDPGADGFLNSLLFEFQLLCTSCNQSNIAVSLRGKE